MRLSGPHRSLCHTELVSAPDDGESLAGKESVFGSICETSLVSLLTIYLLSLEIYLPPPQTGPLALVSCHRKLMELTLGEEKNNITSSKKIGWGRSNNDDDGDDHGQRC